MKYELHTIIIRKIRNAITKSQIKSDLEDHLNIFRSRLKRVESKKDTTKEITPNFAYFLQ